MVNAVVLFIVFVGLCLSHEYNHLLFIPIPHIVIDVLCNCFLGIWYSNIMWFYNDYSTNCYSMVYDMFAISMLFVVGEFIMLYFAWVRKRTGNLTNINDVDLVSKMYLKLVFSKV